MNTIVAEIQSANAEKSLRISIHQVDVGSGDQIQAMFRDIDAKHGQRPDILVSNAGYGKRIPDVSEISLEEFDYTMDINLRASFILVKGVVEHMKDQKWGRIIFMSSIAAQGGGINGCRKFMNNIVPEEYFNAPSISSNLVSWSRLRSFQRRSYRHDEESLNPFSRIQH